MAFKKNLMFGMINIQSVGNKTIKINNLIDELKLDIFMLTETWLSSNISDTSKIREMKPKSHNFYHMPRDDRIGGGVGIFITKLFTDIKVMNRNSFNSFEHIDISIKYNTRNIRMINIYRPPSKSKRIFLDEFSNMLESLSDLGNLLICGDFNLHLDAADDYYVNEFRDLLEVHNLKNSVKSSTSLSQHIIDLVIHHQESKAIDNLIVEPHCTISPTHKLITFELNSIKPVNAREKITYRDKKNFNAEKFIEDSVKLIEDTCVNCECNSNDRSENICVNCTNDSSKKILASKYDETCPVLTKQIVIREKSRWFNNELLEAKKRRRKMEGRWKRAKTSENWLLYTTARNSYNQMVEKCKKKYFTELFAENKNTKIMHSNLDDLLGVKKERVLPENKGCPKSLADNFVHFFEEKINNICMSPDEQDPIERTHLLHVEKNLIRLERWIYLI